MAVVIVGPCTSQRWHATCTHACTPAWRGSALQCALCSEWRGSEGEGVEAPPPLPSTTSAPSCSCVGCHGRRLTALYLPIYMTSGMHCACLPPAAGDGRWPAGPGGHLQPGFLGGVVPYCCTTTAIIIMCNDVPNKWGGGSERPA